MEKYGKRLKPNKLNDLNEGKINFLESIIKSNCSFNGWLFDSVIQRPNSYQVHYDYALSFNSNNVWHFLGHRKIYRTELWHPLYRRLCRHLEQTGGFDDGESLMRLHGSWWCWASSLKFKLKSHRFFVYPLNSTCLRDREHVEL